MAKTEVHLKTTGQPKGTVLSPDSQRAVKAKINEELVHDFVCELVENGKFVSILTLQQQFKDIQKRQLYRYLISCKKKYGYKYLGPCYSPKMTAGNKLVSQISKFTFLGLSLSATIHGDPTPPAGDFVVIPPVYSWVISPRFFDGTGLGLAGGVDVLTMAWV